MEIRELTEYEKNTLINHEGLVKNVITKYLPQFQYCYDDMVQVGYLGLIKGIEAYNKLVENGTQYAFSTIAYRYIQNEIGIYLKKYEYTPFTVSKDNYKNTQNETILSINTSLSDNETLPFEISEEILIDRSSLIGFENVENEIYMEQIISQIKKIIGEKDYEFLINTFIEGTESAELLAKSGKEATKQYKFWKKTQLIHKLKDKLNEFDT